MTIQEEPAVTTDTNDDVELHGPNDSDDKSDGEDEDIDSDVASSDESEEDDSANEDATETDEQSGNTDTVEDTKSGKKKGSNVKTEVVPSKKKIGPQRQKKEIHICMKKGKKFEIRKLTRRIAVLRNLKGTDEQKAKNARKVDKLLLEIQAMKEFMMDELTERVVNIFKGTCEEIYLDIWTAAQSKQEFEKMLQKLSNGVDDKKYENIAFLRMVSSKDILSKLQMVSSGMNIKKPKSKKALQKQLRKYNQKMKKMRLRQAKEGDVSASTTDGDNSVESDLDQETTNSESNNNESKVPTPQQKQMEKVSKVDESNPTKNSKPSKNEQKAKKKVKQRKSKQPSDSFFLQADGNPSDGEEEMSSDEEFAAPATNVKESAPKKKNRMGQRARKKLIEREHAKTMTSKSKYGERNRTAQGARRGGKNTRPKMESKTKVVEDEKLHPSWKAKQKLKTQQGISEFSGTKIVFE